MPGARPRPQSSWAKKEKRPQVVRQGRNHTALPAQWLYGLLRALPGVPGLLAPVAAQLLARLNPSVGGSGPHGLTVRAPAARFAADARPSHPAPRVVAIAKRPP
jgi:hypothetical protein